MMLTPSEYQFFRHALHVRALRRAQRSGMKRFRLKWPIEVTDAPLAVARNAD